MQVFEQAAANNKRYEESAAKGVLGMGIEAALAAVAALLWGPWLIGALLGTGVYYTVGTGFLPIRKLGYIIKDTLGRSFLDEAGLEGDGTLTPFQSAMTALASTVGVGSIVGVATAISFGGPGAVFWMWVSSLFGMCTKYAEITLSIAYREQDDQGQYVGGPACYLRKGLQSEFFARWFSVSVLFAILAGCMIQANALTGNLISYLPLSAVAAGLIIMLLITAVAAGGITRVGKVTAKLVPLKVILYFTGGILVILANAANVPQAVALILHGAFSPIAAGGGAAGYAVGQAIHFGITRGLYANEAGQGTAPIAHAAAKTTHPARQGLWGIVEVLIVLIVCTITSLAILTTGVWESGQTANLLASAAFATVHPLLGYVVSMSIVLCAFSTLIGLCYYGETIVGCLCGSHSSKGYRCLFIGAIFAGSISALPTVWLIGEIAMAVGVVANLIGLAKLSPQVFKLTAEYFAGVEDNKAKSLCREK